MSQERRKRQQERDNNTHGTSLLPKVIVIAVIVAIVGGTIFFVKKRQNNRLDAFARCLSDKGAKMYGAFWCPHCQEQKEMFGSSFEFAPYVECGIKGSRAPAQVCVDANVKHYPTWVFPDGTRVEGEHPLDFLGQATGCPLP